MKYLFLLLLFLIIIISISLVVFRINVIVEKYASFSDANCIYTDKIERSGGDKLSDCTGSETCKKNFELNDGCIKNNFIDKRCKLIKIWYAKKVEGTYYTFSEDNTHIIQMNRDEDLNCQQFDDTDALISYLNSIPQSRIKNNTTSFETEQSIKDDIIEYNAEKERAEKERAEKDPSLNDKDKLIIGYAYGADDTDTQSKKLNDMEVYINFESKFNNDDGTINKDFLKDFLKDNMAEKSFSNPVVNTDEKIVNTNIQTLTRYIKQLLNGTYTIVYGSYDNEKSFDEHSIDFKQQIQCSNIMEKPYLWVLHSDNKYHRVEFIDPLTKDTNICKTIKDPIDPKSQIVTYNNSQIKTEEELKLINYVPVDDTTKDVFELGFNLGDMTKWFAVDGFDRITSENLLTVCSSDQYESAPPNSKLINQNGSDITINTSDRTCASLNVCSSDQYESAPPNSKLINQNGSDITINTSDRICTPLTECRDWNIVIPPTQKEILNSTGQNVIINSSDRKCQPINLASPNSHFIKNYEDVHIGDNKFSGQVIPPPCT